MVPGSATNDKATEESTSPQPAQPPSLAAWAAAAAEPQGCGSDDCGAQQHMLLQPTLTRRCASAPLAAASPPACTLQTEADMCLEAPDFSYDEEDDTHGQVRPAAAFAVISNVMPAAQRTDVPDSMTHTPSGLLCCMRCSLRARSCRQDTGLLAATSCWVTKP